MDVGELLRTARMRANLDQRGLAERARTSRSTVSEYENGKKSPTVRTLDRLLAGCGLQLRVRLEPLMADVDGQVDRMVNGKVELRADQIESFANSLDDRPRPPGTMSLMGLARMGPVTWALDGASALAAQGLAVEHDAPAIVVKLDEALRWWLRAVGLRGQTERGYALGESWLEVDAEVLKESLPGLRICYAGMVRLRIVDELPTVVQMTLEVPGPLLDPAGEDDGPRAEGRPLVVPVLPVHEVERAHSTLAVVLRRWRELDRANHQQAA